ncbi:hypothetical protein PENTCL1PPCAC_30503, partial [Pristionchus entomophagus]
SSLMATTRNDFQTMHPDCKTESPFHISSSSLLPVLTSDESAQAQRRPVIADPVPSHLRFLLRTRLSAKDHHHV